MRKVVITGVGLYGPAGSTIESNKAAWYQPEHRFTEITRHNMDGSSVRFAGQCDKPNTKVLPDRKVQKILRRKDLISLVSNIDLANKFGLATAGIDPERFGMYVGAGSTQIADLTPYFSLVDDCVDQKTKAFDSARFGNKLLDLVSPLVVLQTLMNNALCFGSMTLDIRGVNANFMDFQVAGLRAVGEAFRSVKTGRADLCLAGGVAGPIEPFQIAEGVRNGYLASNDDHEEELGELIKPWSRHSSGTILSEGSAYVLVEEAEHAKRRGAEVLAEVLGFGLSGDGRFDLMKSQDAPGLHRSMNLALEDANLTVDNLGAIAGHGSGATNADLAELSAYQELLGSHSNQVPVFSSKGILGDVGEAGGVVSLVQAIDSLANSQVPPSWNAEDIIEVGSKLAIKPEVQSIKSPFAMVTSRNFFGLSGSLIIGAVA